MGGRHNRASSGAQGPPARPRSGTNAIGQERRSGVAHLLTRPDSAIAFDINRENWSLRGGLALSHEVLPHPDFERGPQEDELPDRYQLPPPRHRADEDNEIPRRENAVMSDANTTPKKVPLGLEEALLDPAV